MPKDNHLWFSSSDSEFKALCKEVRHCTDAVKKEFSEMKKEVLATKLTSQKIF